MTTEEKKKRAINRLKSMYPLRALVDGMYEKAVEASKHGEPVAWCMVNWWAGDTVLHAMGVHTVHPEDYGAVCAAFGAAQNYLDIAGSEGFPSHMCGYARNCLGYAAKLQQMDEIPPDAPMGGMPKPTLLLGSGYFCDTRYKWFQALGRYLDAPVWVLEMPHPGVHESRIEGAVQRDISFIVNELKEFIAFLEKLLGKKMDWDRLEELVDATIEMNRAWHEVNELRKARPCPMHSRDFWSSMPASLYMAADPRETAKLYWQMRDEVKSLIDAGVGAIEEEKYRLAFAELPPWHSLKFFDKLAERGWNFVVESWAYHPPRPLDLSGISDPLERLARLTYQFFAGYFEDAYDSGDAWGYFAHPYLELARDYRCDGMVLHPLLSCRTATNHLLVIQDQLLERLKIPSLVIEGDIVDLKMFDPADALSKAETFEETMDHYKQVRKAEGMEW
ncbi:MAG: 2-hydroxyacyl-CoA dehydratase [Chloroflexi bacterium]|nr:2-hydroxyacyl-CoA dehydratase [Chloroflexota bacterium]